MPRKSRSNGVGRGNGPGSAKTQYREGMPSGNPNGRPKATKEQPAGSLREAFAVELARLIKVTIDSKQIELPMYQAMVASLLNSYPQASPTEKIRLLRFCAEMAPAMTEERDPEPSPGAVDALMALLLEEAERDEEYKKHGIAGQTRQ